MDRESCGTTKRARAILGIVTSVAVSAFACGGASDAPATPPSDQGDSTTPPPGASGSGADDSQGAPPPPSRPSPDAGSTPGPDAGPPPAPLTAAECFKDLTGPLPSPDYDQFKPTIAKSCAGTHHQDITGVQKVVFLGDSVTVGTPPTAPGDFYRVRLEAKLRQKFGAAIEVASCANWGARTNDLLAGDKQIEACFPTGIETKKTLVVMTNGGNDIHGWARDKRSTADAIAAADAALLHLKTSVEWLKSPVHFPNGSFVVFANVYEFTDTSGDLSSCPAATLAGMSGSWPDGKPALVHFEEGFMKVAVQTKTDMMFLFEHFCGHGFKRNDASLQCYRGAGAQLWFDLTCIHPTPQGHEQIALQFEKVIDGT